MLEASRMDRTDVTQGDLEELCESSLGGKMGQKDVSGLLGLPSTSGELLIPGDGSAHTPASVESASKTLTGFNISNIISILLKILFGSNFVRSGNARPVNSYSSWTGSQPPSSRPLSF